ncbi:hypothetical protein SEA_SIXAMA_74 [Gordonia phage Sixama]|uniref:Uncharacterized protein n=1 Tax=Gordonia phage Sixama TaxID=2653271 RepID=A0A5Q2F6A4_9CAUD|nr:hypothetical protein PP302_gp074 [Gordonia phage Sixama]QGF20253.1 hypothetical protein SEA_SIXAMA_74 [Gordonia phage Sixama]
MSAKPEYQLLVDENGSEIAFLLLIKDLGVFYRDSSEWIPMDDSDDLPFDLESLEVRDADASDVDRWDSR